MRKKVLVIDDDADMALLCTLWMHAAGYETSLAYDGRSGLDVAGAYNPDLILLDIMMPGIDGFEVSRRLKTTPHLAHVPVIFLSAKVQEIARQEAIAAGGKYFLSKPYEIDDLVVAVKTALASNDN